MPSRFCFPLLLVSLLAVGYVEAQQPSESIPCSLQNGRQRCSEAALQQAIAAAQSIAIESGPRDKVGDHQLRTLVAKLGRSLALDQQSANLTLKIAPVEQTGVNYGAGDRELARLEVFGRAGDSSSQQLIWVETLSGPADLSWPAAISRLLEQFRHRVQSR